jgi:hypothetical protein
MKAPPGHDQGPTHGKPTAPSWLKFLKHFLILWIVVFAVETVVSHLGFEKQLVELDQGMTNSLKNLDPFALARDFYDRWSDPHSLSAWSLMAPFNDRVHDEPILTAMRELRAQAPPPPATLDQGVIQSGRILALGGTNSLEPPPDDPAAVAAANVQYQRDCQDYLARFREWEAPYHQIASGLTAFDASEYSTDTAPAACGSGASGDLAAAISAGAPSYERDYAAHLDHNEEGSHWPLLDLIWQRVLGFPDALFFTVGRALGRGFFQSILAAFLLVGTFLAARKYPILIPFVPLFAGAFGWFLLELVRSAQLLLHPLLPAPGIPTVAAAAIWPIGGLIDSFFSIVKHQVAHKITEDVEKLHP